MANEYLTGGLGGAATGSGVGFSIGGPTGAGIGAGLGLIGGLLQAGQQKNRMDAYGKAEAAVQPIDPNQVAFLNRLKRQEQFYRAGTDSASAFARQDQGNALAQTQANITRMGGGINQLLRSQQMGNMGYAAIGAQASRMADPMLMAQGNLTNMIAQRQYEYQQRNRDVAMGRMEQGRQDLMNLFAGGIASIPQWAGPRGGGGAGGGGVAGPMGDKMNNGMKSMGTSKMNNFAQPLANPATNMRFLQPQDPMPSGSQFYAPQYNY